MESLQTTTKTRPILFSGEMVRAILSGQKIQTRRVCKPAEKAGLSFITTADAGGMASETNADIATWGDEEGEVIFTCPYGRVGDRLWVREAWALGDDGEYVYRADYPKSDNPWKPSIHLPRKASRILLEIESVRVERLQDISERDALTEGIQAARNPECKGYRSYELNHALYSTPSESYGSLWRSINGEGSWSSNPWVWVIQFRRITP